MASPAPSGRGRPRDPDLEARVFDAALHAYAELGWSGFTLDAVARRARVGRAALYRRWSSKAELLGQALEVRAPPIEPVDTGSTAGDLVELAGHMLRNYREPAGVVGLRAALDARSHPELRLALTAMLDGSRLREARTVVQRAVDRGDIRRGASVSLVLEVLAGAALSHVLFGPATPGDAAPDLDRDASYLQRLVAFVLGAVGTTADGR